MKLKTFYICQKCTYQSPKWIGKCPDCGEWNSFIEKTINPKPLTKPTSYNIGSPQKPISISQSQTVFPKTEIGIPEFDRVLGGGIVSGNLILLGGEPGIGKSTLTLQLCDKLSPKFGKIFYISGEESVEQISLRAKRLSIIPENLSLLNETNFDNIIATLEVEKPDLVIIDSIQVVSSGNVPGNAGTVSQVRFCTEVLMNYAKKNKVPVILIGHVTKDGTLAGPKVLEHLVDAVINLEGDRYQHFRILRSVKNRFGSTNEVGIFEMTETGLQEVKNPSASLLESRLQDSPGTCITCILEGTRPFLIEIQALTNLTAFGYPKRTASGFDFNRLQVLLAVLQQRANINLSNQDVYLNIIGGMKINEPSADLAVCLAIASAYKKMPLSLDVIAIGEIGLSGEIRTVPQLEKRIKEARKFGFNSIISADKKTLKEVINQYFH